MDIQNFKNKIKKNFSKADGLPKVLNKLHEKFNKSSEKYNTLLLLTAEHKKLDDNLIKGLIEYEKENIHLAKIRGRLLKFIDMIDASDIIQNETIKERSIEIGITDLPTKVVFAIGEMTPELAKNRLIRLTESIKNQLETFTDAKNKKDRLGTKAMNKLTALNKSGNKDFRLYKKYLRKLFNAFKDLNTENIKMGEVFNSCSEEFSLLGLYQIQNAYAHNSLYGKNFDELLELSDLLVLDIDKGLPELAKKIKKNKRDFNQNKEQLARFQLKGKAKKTINSEIELRKSLLKFKEEWKIVHDIIQNYREDSM